jgi:hypothetical protein
MRHVYGSTGMDTRCRVCFVGVCPAEQDEMQPVCAGAHLFCCFFVYFIARLEVERHSPDEPFRGPFPKEEVLREPPGGPAAHPQRHPQRHPSGGGRLEGRLWRLRQAARVPRKTALTVRFGASHRGRKRRKKSVAE